MFADNWMPLFGDRFWESERVAAMDDSAVALYSWLLWRQWKHGDLPGPDVLRRLPHRWQATWDAVWPQVEKCFDVDAAGRLSNSLCAEQRAKAEGFSRKKSAAGKQGGRPSGQSTPKADEKQTKSRRKAEAKPGQDRTGQDNPLRGRGSAAPPPLLHEGDFASSLLRMQLSMHPTLDTPSVREALAGWEDHLRSRGRPTYTPQAWSTNLHTWERWGEAKLLKSIAYWRSANSGKAFEVDERDLNRPETNGTGVLDMEALAPVSQLVKEIGERMAKRKRGES